MLYINETKRFFFFITTAIMILMVDIGQFFLAGKAFIPLLLCFYSLLIMRNARSLFLVFIALLECIEYFCFYNSLAMAFIMLIPLTACAFFFKKNLYPSPLYVIFLAFIGLFIQIYIIEGYFLGISSTNSYIISRFAGTLMVSVCFSLTLYIWGIYDNRA
jgi:hypothetical protein